ncbi:aminotransferase class IV [Actinomyces slackii]|nr:aminotransferase class IV [Actinomyces slackii]
MVEGRVRNFDGHLRRLGLNGYRSNKFRNMLKAKWEVLERQGVRSCNPIVYCSDSAIELDMRPDRPFSSSIIVDACGHCDERVAPLVKGPDLAWLRSRMTISHKRGCDEGLLVDKHGFVIEGIFSSLLLVAGSVVTIGHHPRAMRSVTVEQVADIVSDSGFRVEIESEGFSIEELLGTEVLFLNAFSGVRYVTEWSFFDCDSDVTENVKSSLSCSIDVSWLNSLLWELADKI